MRTWDRTDEIFAQILIVVLAVGFIFTVVDLAQLTDRIVALEGQQAQK